MVNALRTLFCATVVLFATPALAEDQPDEVISKVTKDVVKLIEDARSYADKDPQRFYRNVDAVMANVVDFPGFARGVMGRYGSRAYYQSLDAAGQKALRRQAARFTGVFKDRLIQTYAKGLLAFNGNRIEVVPLKDSERGSKNVNVRQLIYAEGPTPYVLIYKMRQNAQGKWLARNVSIEGINLGSTYRTQFAAAAAANKGNLDAVIDSWSVSPDAEQVADNDNGDEDDD